MARKEMPKLHSATGRGWVQARAKLPVFLRPEGDPNRRDFRHINDRRERCGYEAIPSTAPCCCAISGREVPQSADVEKAAE